MTKDNPGARELLAMMRAAMPFDDAQLRAYWTVDTALRSAAKANGFDPEAAREVLGTYDPDTDSVDGE